MEKEETISIQDILLWGGFVIGVFSFFISLLVLFKHPEYRWIHYSVLGVITGGICMITSIGLLIEELRVEIRALKLKEQKE